MKAVVYNGPRDVSVKNVPDARIEQPNDVIVKITTTNICGSDGPDRFQTGRRFRSREHR
jgi:glutathione-independent formaldehyde dehydrogenase